MAGKARVTTEELEKMIAEFDAKATGYAAEMEELEEARKRFVEDYSVERI